MNTTDKASEYYSPDRIVLRLTQDIKNFGKLKLFDEVLTSAIARLREDPTALNEALRTHGDAFADRIVHALKVIAFYGGISSPSRIGFLQMVAGKQKRVHVNDGDGDNIADALIAMQNVICSQDVYRPTLHGVHVEQSGKHHVITATDGYVLTSLLVATGKPDITKRPTEKQERDPSKRVSEHGTYKVSQIGTLYNNGNTDKYPPWQNVVYAFPRANTFFPKWSAKLTSANDPTLIVLDVRKALEALEFLRSCEKGLADVIAVASASKLDIALPLITEGGEMTPRIKIAGSVVTAEKLTEVLTVAAQAGFSQMTVQVHSSDSRRALMFWPTTPNKTKSAEAVTDMIGLVMPVHDKENRDWPTFEEIGEEGTIVA